MGEPFANAAKVLMMHVRSLLERHTTPPVESTRCLLPVTHATMARSPLPHSGLEKRAAAATPQVLQRRGAPPLLPWRGFQPTMQSLKTWMVPVAAVSSACRLAPGIRCQQVSGHQVSGVSTAAVRRMQSKRTPHNPCLYTPPSGLSTRLREIVLRLTTSARLPHAEHGLSVRHHCHLAAGRQVLGPCPPAPALTRCLSSRRLLHVSRTVAQGSVDALLPQQPPFWLRWIAVQLSSTPNSVLFPADRRPLLPAVVSMFVLAVYHTSYLAAAKFGGHPQYRQYGAPLHERLVANQARAPAPPRPLPSPRHQGVLGSLCANLRYTWYLHDLFVKKEKTKGRVLSGAAAAAHES